MFNVLWCNILGNFAPRKGRVTIIEPHQPSKLHSNHIHLEESHHKPRPLGTDEERAEKINSDLEKMIQFMTVLGQVDRYLSSRAKSFVTTLGRAMEGNPNDRDIYSDRDNMMSSLEY